MLHNWIRLTSGDLRTAASEVPIAGCLLDKARGCICVIRVLEYLLLILCDPALSSDALTLPSLPDETKHLLNTP